MSSVLYKIFEIVLYFTILTQIGQLSLNIPAVYDVLVPVAKNNPQDAGSRRR
jgi:hypothetical protein